MSGVTVALETSTRTPTVAARFGDWTGERELSHARAHASDLLPELAELLREGGARPAQIGTVIVGTGPGSYTGLRVGVALALGLARASGARLVGVPSTETWAFGALPAGATAGIVIDARSEEFYFASQRRTAGDVEVLRAPCVLDAAQLDAALASMSLVLTDPDSARAARLERRRDLLIETSFRPRATSLLELGSLRLAQRGPEACSAVAPLYLRAFAARSRRR
jgi:tRNA threonylcarbamoyladenosine biosynthesis protein TsaB